MNIAGPFIGRQREIRQCIDSLSSGRNLILSGKFGIGRTSLVRHVARITNEKWKFLFADFSENPNQVCRKLEKQLNRSISYNKPTLKGYKSRRRKIISLVSADPVSHILVLDNIAKLTAQKLNLIRYFVSDNSFFTIAITESFLAADELFALRMALLPADQMTLRRLRMSESIEMIRTYLENNRLAWGDEQLRTAAIITRGYPLGMVEFISKSRFPRSSANDRLSEF